MKDLNMTERITEAELANATKITGGVRVTNADVEAYIESEYFFTAADGVAGSPNGRLTGGSNLALMTFCVLTLKNGWTVHGMSACVDPKNFNEEIGKRIARDNAKTQIWGFLGFELRTKLDMVEKATKPSRGQSRMNTYVGTKVVHAQPMNRLQYNQFRGWQLPENENGMDDGYLVEYADGGESNVPGFTGYVSWSPKDVFDRAYGVALS